MSIAIETAIKDTGGKHISPAIVHCPVVGGITEDGPNQTGVAYAGWKLVDRAVELGLDFRTQTTALQLLQDEAGKVTGVVAQDADGNYIRCNAAKGVILCTGGFYGTGYPWYYGGINIGKAITFCRVAAKDAAAH